LIAVFSPTAFYNSSNLPVNLAPVVPYRFVNSTNSDQKKCLSAVVVAEVDAVVLVDPVEVRIEISHAGKYKEQS
jgi:hypothetical protein